ncbi:uncharacterized protein VICG_01577 [Vittaforma corneae ATCC 50505]|uniref:Exoribonuclease phosphorolytic domain-containing protein n=1 Tax=Vittaforma corneae (strain ATCC 50505) TaxID=993615 RepID=L2GM12_VITCO|nr:uncharacterized protein VICG_01577 [Vittaforma corneae ATCC 50505]ELA41337.1 hypothetical protein VICG_01577 [Vittaforma corneae ATCC 50505]
MLVKELASKKLRMSGRACEESRDTHLKTFPNVLVVRSGTSPQDSCIYLAFSKAKARPYPDKPSEGAFQIGLEKGRKNDALLNFLHSVYVRSKCISTTDLCLRFNQEAYSISIEVSPIQTNGDLFRLCVEGINEIIRVLEVKTYFLPKAVQFGCVEGALMQDPDEAETLASEWTMTVVMKSARELLLVEKSGEGVGVGDILRAIDCAMLAASSKV